MRQLFTFLIVTLATQLSAQLKEFNISEMPRPEVAVVQANAQFSDDALLLIYSTIEGLEFRSSLGGIDKQTYNAVASRYEVLIKPLKQMVFSAKQGYIEGKIATLNPQPKDVFYYRVEEKQNESPADAPPGKLQISSEPAGAEIFLNGFKVADKTPFTFDILGNTKIKLQKKDYETLDTSVIVTSANTIALHAKLRPTFLYVNISSNPSGASVWLDGVQLGATPLKNYKIDFKKFEGGNKTILIKAEGYDEITEVKNISPSIDPLDLSFNLKRQLASFTIASNPPGASVFIDNVYRGVTPYTASKELGTYEVYVQLEGYSNSEKKQLVLSNSSAQQLNFSLKSELPEAEREAAAEADNAFGEVRIGNQIWMAQNLNTTQFSNGEIIPEAKTAKEWRIAGDKKQPAWCYYDNNTKNGEKYGKLYNWYAVADARNICPTGWHVPSDSDWKEIIEYLGDHSVAGGRMKSKNSWKFPNANATNESNFNGLPAGFRDNDGTFSIMGYNGAWWSATEANEFSTWFRYLDYANGDAYRGAHNKRNGASVRCLKD